MAIDSLNEYRYAAELAQDANHAAEDGRKIYTIYEDQLKRLVEWDRTIAPQRATFIAFIVLFPFIAVAEYLFSEELYRDVLPKYPWAMGIIFGILAIVIAEMLVYRFFEVKRQWKANELRRSDKWNQKVDAIIDKHIKKITQRQFYVGLFLLILMLVILAYMSIDRVQSLFRAGDSASSFRPVDTLPIILYFFEVVTGMFIWYGILRLGLGFKVNKLKRTLDNSVKKCSELTIDSVQSFNKAEKLGYNSIMNPVTNSIQEAFCRNDSLSEAKGIEYISEQKTDVFEVSLKLLFFKDNSDFTGNVKLVTDYKFTYSEGVTNGILNMKIASFLRFAPELGNKTGDSIRTIIAEFDLNGTLTEKTINVAIDLDLPGPHTVYV
jgi:hypothetical protein